ncbi:response regulator transcription factor [Geothrix sp. PMB-07]|uniref:response regulator transcription factor n=1 Tax=Geothrix sp. PMB-07 TaxID=3068640 RepID=UPI002740E9D5|nr:response regulator transcription factor [Geothrix sp. PMB-07]WLT32566.1 response regulator transcription factor [Geothrix sp. PMB-07]
MTAPTRSTDGPTPPPVPNPIRVVICEDQPVMRDYLLEGLAHVGITAAGVADGMALRSHLEAHQTDIVILDIGLPGEDGYTIASRLRQERPHLGIIMLTARDQTDDRVQGLDAGADLYFSKPVDLRELASAIGSLHRRLAVSRPKPSPARWRLDGLRSTLVTPTGVAIPLTDNELRFLTPLLDQPGEVVDREVLSEALEQIHDIYAMRRMETMLSRLRTKVQKASPDEPLPVRARHGRGYAFLSEAEGVADQA